MFKFLLPVAAVAIAAPALAAQPTPIAFERDGVRYVGTIEQRGDTQLISGHEVGTGAPFDLVVRNGRVSGTYGLSAVSYTLAQK